MADDPIDILTPEETTQDILKSYTDVAREKGIDEAFVVQKHKKEFAAQSVKHITVEGRIEDETVPKGYRIVGVFKNSDGNPRTLLEYKGPDMPIRQKARESVHSTFGHKQEKEIFRDQYQTIIFQTLMPEPDPPPDESDKDACISGTEHLIDG